MSRSGLPLENVHDLRVLLRAHHPVIFLETADRQRAEALLEHCAEQMGLLSAKWAPGRGLQLALGGGIDDTATAAQCLQHILQSQQEVLYHLTGFAEFAHEPAVAALLEDVHKKLWEDQGAIAFSGNNLADFPDRVARLATHLRIAPPTELEYHKYLQGLLADMRRHNTIRVRVGPHDVARLIQNLRGLTLDEVKQTVSGVIAKNWALDPAAVDEVLVAKRAHIERSGVLEYVPADVKLEHVAGLEKLKVWLKKRSAAFASPEKARSFGLVAPRGLLLLGVPGCGKSLVAKAIASEYKLPLIRFDSSLIYDKFVGSSERNLRQAMRTVESMAPLVVWIDEIEKLMAQDNGGDAGLSQRVLGNMLSWLQEKPEGILVVATCNDVQAMPPELLRKGRFDEIFFVDLPTAAARKKLFAMHLSQRKQGVDEFDLSALADSSAHFSGAEIEQTIVSAMYTAFSENIPLSQKHIVDELGETRTINDTMAEKIAELRSFAKTRAVAADDPGP
jgi:AAA+ superfamily predicted ATPase